MNHTLYQTFKIIKYFIQRHEKATDNPPIKIYANKIENEITFRITAGKIKNLRDGDVNPREVLNIYNF